MAGQPREHVKGDAVASVEPPRLGPVGAFVVVLVVLVVASLVARRIEDPKWQLRVYVIAVVWLLLSSSLRWAAMKALFLLVVVGVAVFFGRYRDDVDRGQISRGEAVRSVVHDLTGIRIESRGVAHAAGSPRIDGAEYLAYLGKIDPRSRDINQKASELARGCGPLDRLCETARILAFVTDQVEYRSDPRGGEYIKSPQETVAAMAGDCEDKSILLISLLESLGHRTFMVFTPNHAYALDCYDRGLDDLLAQGVEQLGRADRLAYLRDLAPRHDPRSLIAALGGAVGLRIENQYCYPLESTQVGSWIGVNNGEHEYVTAFDPVSKQRVQFRN
jgi:hypothetical protein